MEKEMRNHENPDYEKLGDTASELLKENGYLEWIGDFEGIRIEARADEDTLIFSHNLGAENRPDKKSALLYLDKLVRFREILADSSESFASMCKDKRFAAELIVFSGQMDFRVAEMSDGKTEWFTELD